MTSEVDWKKEETPLSQEEIQESLKQIQGWKLNGAAIEKEFKFADFKQAIYFVDTVADLAEELNHHPDIQLWNITKVKVRITTFCTGNLSKLDFKLASKIDKKTQK